jgi:uncharacterized glyoxalase superfamily protein PhnB
MRPAIKLTKKLLMFAAITAIWPSIPAHVHVYVGDVDATYQSALAAGTLSVQEPQKKDDADKRGGVKDASGTTWWIATS